MVRKSRVIIIDALTLSGAWKSPDISTGTSSAKPSDFTLTTMFMSKWKEASAVMAWADASRMS